MLPAHAQESCAHKSGGHGDITGRHQRAIRYFVNKVAASALQLGVVCACTPY
jgi:hypothetical protein